MAAELKNDPAFRPLLDDAFRRWEAPLARGLQTIQDRGELVADADPNRLATTVIAALQGGMLLARVRGDIAPLRDTLEGAVAQLRQSRPTPSARRRSTRTGRNSSAGTAGRGRPGRD
jgi:hypothetical protein